MNRLHECALFFGAFLRDPSIASVVPTSRAGARAICRNIDTEHSQVIVEYGPGMGAISRRILERMSPHSRLILIEKNPLFAAHLRDALKNDSRATVHEGDASDARKVLRAINAPSANCVISGIPLSSLPVSEREQIVQDTYDILASGGTFIVYQFRKTVERSLKRTFKNVQHRWAFANLPPLTIFEAKKSP